MATTTTPPSAAVFARSSDLLVPGDPFALTRRGASAICAERLRESSFNEFVVQDDEIDVTVFEVPSSECGGRHDGGPHHIYSGQSVAKRQFRDTQSLLAHCRADVAPPLRILSIPQDSSYDELEITKDCMEQLLAIHGVSVDFLNVLYAAGKPPRDSEEGFGQAIESYDLDGSFALAYLSRYYGQREQSWKLRQTGVYHAYDAVTKSNLFILLHPSKNSAFEKGLSAFAAQPGSATALSEQPTRVHAMLFSAYFDNWRAFLQDKGDGFIQGAEKLFVANIDGEEYLDISFKKLQAWRDLEDRIMPLTSMFQALLDLLDALQRIDEGFADKARTLSTAMTPAGQNSRKISKNFFRSRKGPVKALMASSSGLQKRIHGVLNLLADTLEMRNHKQLARTNDHLLNLQRENVEDSDTVQIVTVVTLMYLPASFVATLFGMNLFGFNAATARIHIAKDFWLYMAVMLPLTFVTVFYWYVRTKKSRAERRKRLLPANEIAHNAVVSKNWFQMQGFGQHVHRRAVTTV